MSFSFLRCLSFVYFYTVSPLRAGNCSLISAIYIDGTYQLSQKEHHHNMKQGPPKPVYGLDLVFQDYPFGCGTVVAEVYQSALQLPTANRCSNSHQAATFMKSGCRLTFFENHFHVHELFLYSFVNSTHSFRAPKIHKLNTITAQELSMIIVEWHSHSYSQDLLINFYVSFNF